MARHDNSRTRSFSKSSVRLSKESSSFCFNSVDGTNNSAVSVLFAALSQETGTKTHDLTERFRLVFFDNMQNECFCHFQRYRTYVSLCVSALSN